MSITSKHPVHDMTVQRMRANVITFAAVMSRLPHKDVLEAFERDTALRNAWTARYVKLYEEVGGKL